MVCRSRNCWEPHGGIVSIPRDDHGRRCNPGNSWVGAADDQPPASNVSIYTADATKAVINTSWNLSPLSQINLAVVKTAFEGATGVNFQDMTANAIVDSAVGIAAQMGLDIASAIPVMGQAFQAAMAVVAIASSSGDAAKAQAQAWCQSYITRHAMPVPSGSMLAGCHECPADIFAITIPWGTETQGAEYRGGRPWIGEALMRLTEGAQRDPEDWRYWKTDEKKWKKRESDLQATYELTMLKFKMGVPMARRQVFRKVRRAIEANYGPRLPASVKSDGGMALWTVYLDMLLYELTKGGLQSPVSYFLLATNSPYDKANKFTGDLGDFSCTQGQWQAIVRLSQNWNNTINPFYTLGKEAAEKLKKKALDVAVLSQLFSSRRFGAGLSKATKQRKRKRAVQGGMALGALAVISKLAGLW